MELGNSVNEETGELFYSYLTFETGKKILISNEEKKELLDWVNSNIELYIKTGELIK